MADADQSPRLDAQILAALPPAGAEHEESCTVSFTGGGSCRCYRAPLVGAVRAVLDEHQPTVLSADVRPGQFGIGKCAYCDKHPFVRVYPGRLDRPNAVALRHDHVDPYPQCQCQEGSEDPPSWPCPTIRVIATALGINEETARA